MSTPYRFIPDAAKRWKDPRGRPIAVVEVTIRTNLGHYLLKPTPRSRSLILGVLGRAQKQLEFQLYGYAYLSNHGSMLIGVRSARHLARIMEFVHGNIARELGRKEHSNWPGRFWGRRGRPIVVLTEADLAIRMKYLLSNSVKEGLVTHPARWPGAHCARALCEGRAEVGTWVDRTQLRQLRLRARVSGQRVSEADTSSHYRLKLSKLPCWSHMSNEQHKHTVRRICHEISVEAAQQRRHSGRPVVGVKRLLRLSAHHRPDYVERSPAPLVHCRSTDLRRWFIEAYNTFVDAYRAAQVRMHGALIEVRYPPGGIPAVNMPALRH